MKKLVNIMILVAAVICTAAPYQSDEFDVASSAMNAGIGGIRTVIDANGLTALCNPALVASFDAAKYTLAGGSYYQSMVNVFVGGAVFKLGKTSCAASFRYIGGDDIPITELSDTTQPMSPDNRPQIIGYDNHYTLSADFAAAKRFGEKVHAGASIRAVHKKLIQHSAWGFSATAGVTYDVFDRAKLALMLGDVFGYALFWDDSKVEYAAPEASIGAAYEIPLNAHFNLTLATETSYGIENGMGMLRAGAIIDYAKKLRFALGTQDGALRTGASFAWNTYELGASASYDGVLGYNYTFDLTYFLGK